MDHHTVSLRDGDFPLMAFDTETSGTDATTANIITWGTSTADDPEHEVVLRLPENVTELDEANVAVHGYSMEKIEELGGDRIEGLIAAFETLDNFNSTTNGFIVGHNVVYDMTILDAELRRENMADKADKIDSWRVIDTYPLLESSDLIGAFKTVLKLNIIAETLGVEQSILENAHNAAADSLVAAALFTQMVRYFPHLGGMTSTELVEYMRKTAIRVQYKKQAIFQENRLGYPVLREIKRKINTDTTTVPKKHRKKKASSGDTDSKKTTTATRRRSTSRSSARLRNTTRK